MDTNENMYYETNQLVQTAIPDLLKLLIDEDLVIVQQTSILLSQMSRIEVLRIGLIQTENTCQCIVNCLNTTADLETARNLLSTLYGISMDIHQGVETILKSSALEPLIKILNAPLDILVAYSLSTIHNILLTNNQDVLKTIRQLGGLNQLIILLNLTDDVKFLTILIDCIYLLSFQNYESKKLINEIGGVQFIMSIFINRTSIYPKLDYCLIRLIKSLSVYQENKIILINYGLLDRLDMSLIKANLYDCLILIKNLSDQASILTTINTLITNLCNILTDPCVSISNKQTILYILSNLTANNESNKALIIELNFVMIILEFLNEPKFVEPCMNLLNNLINRNGKCLIAQEQIKNFGLNILNNLFDQKQFNRQIVSLIKNIGKNYSFFESIKNSGIIDKVICRLSDPDSNIEEIKLYSSCILLFANEKNIRDYLKKAYFVFKQMISSNHVEIKKIGFSLLYEICQEIN